MTINIMENLKKYTITELNLMLKRVEEMIVIPIVNRFNLNKLELIEMKKQLETELNNRKFIKLSEKYKQEGNWTSAQIIEKNIINN
tara:strand:- start:267 stop:524 length:258 start_codon:yes stop_codon:yes gene_type:complete